MSVEPGIIDTNVLVYATDADAPQHMASRALLDVARAAPGTFSVTSQLLCEFYSIVTNARRVAKPRSSAEATDAIASMLDFLRVLPVPASAVEGWIKLLRRHPVTGGLMLETSEHFRSWRFLNRPLTRRWKRPECENLPA
jgi:predicted nucleic acid-binding protein